VANSLRKSVVRPEATGESLMYRTGVAQSALWWSAFDLLTTGLDVVGRVPFTSVRYEDFVADPRGILDRVLDFAQVSHAAADLDHVRGDRIQLGPNHQVAGNPVRFRTGEVTVRRDEAWRDQLTLGEQRAVLALTAGLRRRYGYR
jgi:hypothetical protein